MKHLLAFLLLSILTGCEFGGGAITLDPVGGICYRSPDGKYLVCYNPALPANRAYTIKANAPGGTIVEMGWHGSTRTWRATMTDGTVAVYDSLNGLRFEPALPSK